MKIKVLSVIIAYCITATLITIWFIEVTGIAISD